MPACRPPRPVLAMPLLALAAMMATGCSGTQEPAIAPRAGLACVDDSPQCIAQRQATLSQLMQDRERRWVKEPVSAQAHASGVRLFAYRSRKKELSCDELQHGKREADAAPASLRGPGGAGLTPAQVSRGIMLAAEVSRELGNEHARRCKRA